MQDLLLSYDITSPGQVSNHHLSSEPSIHSWRQLSCQEACSHVTAPYQAKNPVDAQLPISPITSLSSEHPFRMSLKPPHRFQRNPIVNDPRRTRYQWCCKTYASAGAYSNHVERRHPKHHREIYSGIAHKKEQPDDLDLDSGENLAPDLQDSDHEDLEETVETTATDTDSSPSALA